VGEVTRRSAPGEAEKAPPRLLLYPEGLGPFFPVRVLVSQRFRAGLPVERGGKHPRAPGRNGPEAQPGTGEAGGSGGNHPCC